ncbi:hypothetical protein C5167_030993 [Papaver somniferum]|nr:hypothetical protein C5167_030993 [Papaver somniferum]
MNSQHRKETEDEPRTSNWVVRNWGPWEEILLPEADFARRISNEGEEVAFKSHETIEAFRMLKQKQDWKNLRLEESGFTEAGQCVSTSDLINYFVSKLEHFDRRIAENSSS